MAKEASLIDYDGARLCAVPDSLEATDCKWSTPHVYWTIADSLSGVSDADFKACAMRAWQSLMDVCGIRLEYTDRVGHLTAADQLIVMTTGDIDGPAGVLAWSELPCGVRVVRVTQKFDDGDQWYPGEWPIPQGFIGLENVIAHEGCHALGLPHGGDDLMRPYYAAAVKKPGPWTITELQARYGKPVVAPPPPTPTTPPVVPPAPTPSPKGWNFMGGLLSILTLLQQIAPLLQLLQKMWADPQFQALVHALLDAFKNQPSVTVKEVLDKAHLHMSAQP